MAYRKPLTLAIIAVFAIGLAMVGQEGGTALLVFGFLLYLCFGEA